MDIGVIDFTSWPVWTVATLLALNLLKQPLANLWPNLFGFLTTRAEAAKEQRLFEADAGRQDEVAIISAMVSLQQQIVKQNADLFNFIKDRLDKRLEAQSALINQKFQDFEQRLRDIDNRWIAASRQSDGLKNEIAMFRNEITRMVDEFADLQRELNKILPGRGRDE